MTTTIPHRQACARAWIHRYLVLLAAAGAVSWAVNGAVESVWRVVGHLAVAAIGCGLTHRVLHAPWATTRFDMFLGGWAIVYSAFLPVSIAGPTWWSWVLASICWSVSFVVVVRIDGIARASARTHDRPMPVQPTESG